MIEALAIALELIKRFEGCRLRAYQDIVGVWTIGYGSTGGVHAGMVWTQEQADAVLSLRVKEFLLGVLQACPQLVSNPYQLAACTSLAYNIGLGAFKASSVCRYTKRGEIEKAANSFELWDKAGQRVVRGLTLRRLSEKEVFLHKQLDVNQ